MKGRCETSFGKKLKEYLSLDNIQCISWVDHICNWLTGLLVKLNEPIKSIVMQYIDAIYVVAFERNKKVMEKNLEILYESPASFSAGLEIEEFMKTAKLHLMCLMFDDFKEEMKTIESKYGLELEKEGIG